MNYAVLMHIYNEEKFIERSLESILGQSLQPEFILIVDDGSKDRTAEIINSYEIEYHLVKPDYSKSAYIRRSEAFNVGVSIIQEKPVKPDCLLKQDGDIVIEPFYAVELLRHFKVEPHTAAMSGISTEYKKTRNLNNGAVMYRFKLLPFARTVSGWDLDIENHLVGNGFNCIVDPTVSYTDLRPPKVFSPRLDKILRNRFNRKLFELKGKLKR